MGEVGFGVEGAELVMVEGIEREAVRPKELSCEVKAGGRRMPKVMIVRAKKDLLELGVGREEGVEGGVGEVGVSVPDLAICEGDEGGSSERGEDGRFVSGTGDGDGAESGKGGDWWYAGGVDVVKREVERFERGGEDGDI